MKDGRAEWALAGWRDDSAGGRRPRFRMRWLEFSKSYARTRDTLANLEYKEGLRNRNYCHRITTHLIREHDYIVLPDYDIEGMTRSARGTMEAPGTGVTRKRRANKTALSQTWGMIRRQLAKAVSVLDVKVFQLRNRSAAHTVWSTVFPDAPRRSGCNSIFRITATRATLPGLPLSRKAQIEDGADRRRREPPSRRTCTMPSVPGHAHHVSTDCCAFCHCPWTREPTPLTMSTPCRPTAQALADTRPA